MTGLTPIKIELARKVLQDGIALIDVPSMFKTPNGKQCLTTLMVYNHKFYILTIAIFEEKEEVALMKAGHLEISYERAKETFGNQVDFVELVPKEPLQNNFEDVLKKLMMN